jgi:hypothetical protein
MRECHLIAPGLAAWREMPRGELAPMPGLERLLARGQAVDAKATLTGRLCQAFGVARQQDFPLAPICAERDGLDAASGYWLRADPVHLHLGMRGMTLLDAQQVGLSNAESEALAAALAPLFVASGWRLLAPRAPRWYASPKHPIQLTTTPIDQVASRHVNSALPTGSGAEAVMRLLNEVQILLHEHPVNLDREVRGQAPINSLWLWGGGVRPAASPRYSLLLAEQAEALALAAYTGIQALPCPAKAEQLPQAESALVVLPEFPLDALVEAAVQLDREWFQPLLSGLRRGRLRRLELSLTGAEGRVVQLGMRDAWKFW